MQSAFPVIPELLTERLRAAIVFGDMAPGSRIVEEDVAQRFQVSRSPVREALRRLMGEGLVSREERRGAIVTPISRGNLDEVYSCRIPLEALAAAQAATSRSPAQLTRLQSVMAELEAQTGTDIRAFFKANVTLTDAIHDASGNLTAKRLLGGIGQQAQRYRYIAYRDFPHLIAISVEGNHAIVQAIARQDEAAGPLTSDLIGQSWRTIRDCIPEAPCA